MNSNVCNFGKNDHRTIFMRKNFNARSLCFETLFSFFLDHSYVDGITSKSDAENEQKKVWILRSQKKLVRPIQSALILSRSVFYIHICVNTTIYWHDHEREFTFHLSTFSNCHLTPYLDFLSIHLRSLYLISRKNFIAYRFIKHDRLKR